MLEGLPGETEPPEGSIHREGGFSIVADTATGRVKKLPSLYVNTTQLFASRDPSAVHRKLLRTVNAFMSSAERSVYMLTACEIEGRRGLFGSDFFNRSVYRQKLKRQGMTFSDDPFVEFHEDGTFDSEDRDRFRPEFLALPRRSDNPAGVIRTSGALLVHRLAFYRIADVEAEELSRLVSLASTLEAMMATDPLDLAAALTAPPSQG
jgi:hypothetical protein